MRALCSSPDRIKEDIRQKEIHNAEGEHNRNNEGFQPASDSINGQTEESVVGMDEQPDAHTSVLSEGLPLTRLTLR